MFYLNTMHLKNNYILIYGQHACNAVLKSQKREIIEILLQNDKENELKKNIPQNLLSKV